MSRKATTELEKLAVTARHPFQEAMERAGPISFVGVMLSVGAFARLTSRVSIRTLLARTQGLDPVGVTNEARRA